jgi:hypothetical protein
MSSNASREKSTHAVQVVTDSSAVLSRIWWMHRPMTASSLQQPDQPTKAQLKHVRSKKHALGVRSTNDVTNINAYHKDTVQVDTLPDFNLPKASQCSINMRHPQSWHWGSPVTLCQRHGDFMVSGLNRLCPPCSTRSIALALAGHKIAEKTECRCSSLQAENADVRHQHIMSASSATA